VHNNYVRGGIASYRYIDRGLGMISIGTKVRSFDFPHVWDFPDPKDTSDDPAPTHRTGFDLHGDRACYVEGTVIEIGPRDEYDCPRYHILVSRDVFGGEERTGRVDTLVYPPVNGTPTLFGSSTDSVEVIEPDKYGNVLKREGCDRCSCGSKYYEDDVCIDCGIPPSLLDSPRVGGVGAA